MSVLRTKSIERSIRETEDPEHQLKKNLSWIDLTLFGIGVIIGAAFGAVDHDEIRQQFRLGRRMFVHGLGDAEPFPGMANGQLEADRLAAGQLAQARHEAQQPDR